MEKVKREKLIMKIICTALAVILWFYVSFFENPTMTKTVNNVPVRITDEQLDRLNSKGLAIYSISKNSVDVKVTARRLTLATQTRKTLSGYINISAINQSGTYYLPANIVSDDGASASYYVEGKDIKVVVEPIISGTFPVQADVESSYPGYLDYELSNDTVKISAPQSIYDEIHLIRTEQVILDDRINTKEKTLVLYDVDGNVLDKENVEIFPSYIDITFSYLDEKDVPIIVATNSGKEITLPEEYNITIHGESEILDTVSSIKTSIIDLSKYDNGAIVKAKLNFPAGVKYSEKNNQVEFELTTEFFK